jgi:hypothetical protein
LKGGSSSERQEREANPPKSIPQGLNRLREKAAFRARTLKHPSGAEAPLIMLALCGG